MTRRQKAEKRRDIDPELRYYLQLPLLVITSTADELDQEEIELKEGRRRRCVDREGKFKKGKTEEEEKKRASDSTSTSTSRVNGVGEPG
ncbi:hypothetical protein Dda_4848 [Drechslerella dactyloides]|uniref:Uncharacterized protein n=1 Tax=Drechslerella dactyloides TaxID=74499 RepID=A0AAD6J225_DREDA|nr:hypothetical protein Dda_4848 [Drechslerella dactyloides]